MSKSRLTSCVGALCGHPNATASSSSSSSSRNRTSARTSANANSRASSSSNSTIHYAKVTELIRKYYYNGKQSSDLQEIKDYLHNNRFNINTRNVRGETLLICEATDKTIVDLLVKEGADINIQDNLGNTALIYRTSWNHIINGPKKTLAVVEALIENGADVNIQNNLGNTVLMNAIEYVSDDALDILKLVIKANGNLLLRNNRGYDAFYVAYKKTEFFKTDAAWNIYQSTKENMEKVIKIIGKEVMKAIGKDIKNINKTSILTLHSLTTAREDSQGNKIPALPVELVRYMMKQAKILLPSKKTPTSAKSDPTHKKNSNKEKQNSY